MARNRAVSKLVCVDVLLIRSTFLPRIFLTRQRNGDAPFTSRDTTVLLPTLAQDITSVPAGLLSTHDRLDSKLSRNSRRSMERKVHTATVATNVLVFAPSQEN